MKPSFDSLTLACVVDQLQMLEGHQVQRLGMPAADQLILSAYQWASGEQHLLFDISASWARTHLMRSAPPKTQRPLAFESALRKYVLDGFITSIRQHGFDRIIEIDIDGAHGEVQLIGEFTGHRSNLILCRSNPDGSKTILHAAKLIPTGQNRHREILPGRPYVLPPQQGKIDLYGFLREIAQNTHVAHHTFQTLAPPDSKVLFGDWLKSTLEGVSPLLQREILFLADEDLWQGLVQTATQISVWQPVIYMDKSGHRVLAYPIPLQHLKSTFEAHFADSIHQALHTVFREAAPRAALEQRKSTLEGMLRKTIQQNEHALRQVQRGLGESSRAARHRLYGELLYAQLQAVNAGAESVTLQNYYNGEKISIPLDKNLSAPENAARYFERAKHSEAGQADLERRRQQLENAQTQYAQLAKSVRQATTLEELETVQRALPRQVSSPQKGREQVTQFDGHRIKSLESPDGYEVLVGENATSNDYLVRHVMKPLDWWLHLRGATSAHAVVRSAGAPQKVPQSTLLFAAREVAKRSAAKHAGYAAVDYTQGKYVRKPRKSAPGSVNYEREKTLHLTKEN